MLPVWRTTTRIPPCASFDTDNTRPVSTLFTVTLPLESARGIISTPCSVEAKARTILPSSGALKLCDAFTFCAGTSSSPKIGIKEGAPLKCASYQTCAAAKSISLLSTSVIKSCALTAQGSLDMKMPHTAPNTRTLATVRRMNPAANRGVPPPPPSSTQPPRCCFHMTSGSGSGPVCVSFRCPSPHSLKLVALSVSANSGGAAASGFSPSRLRIRSLRRPLMPDFCSIFIPPAGLF
ncbi:hypothetical protein D3C80_1184740 [compost metagenome]